LDRRTLPPVDGDIADRPMNGRPKLAQADPAHLRGSENVGQTVSHARHLPLLVFTKRRGLMPITIRNLLWATLRHRPERMLVGEVRGVPLRLFQALNSGHSGRSRRFTR
jgi:hypothetical protein